MLPALATLAFLLTLILFAVMAAEVIEQRDKIVSALRGHSQLATKRQRLAVPVRVSLRVRQGWTLRARPQRRAAA